MLIKGQEKTGCVPVFITTISLWVFNIFRI